MASQRWRSVGLVALCWSVTVSFASGADAPKPRKWKDVTGKFEIEATFVRLEGDKVTLKQTNGDVVEIPINQLSIPDVQYVVSEQTGLKLPMPGGTPADEAASSSGPDAQTISWAG